MAFNWNAGASTNSANANANNKSQGGFGSNNNNSNNNSQGGFGGNTNNNGGSQPSMTFNFSSSGGGGGGPQQNRATVNGSNPMVAVQRIADQYNPQSAGCRFQTVLFNQTPQGVAPSMLEKPPLIRPQIWAQGVQSNPYPKRLIPVAVAGYNDLTLRSELCLSAHVKLQKEMQSKEEALRGLRDRMEVSIKPMIADLKQNQIQLSHRLLAVLRGAVCRMAEEQTLGPNQNASNLPLAVALSHSHLSGRSAWESPLSAKELQMKAELDRLSRESRELMAGYSRIHKMWDHLNIDGVTANIRRVTVSNDGLEPKNMKLMFDFLKQQQSFVQLLASTVQADLKDLAVIRQGS